MAAGLQGLCKGKTQKRRPGFSEGPRQGGKATGRTHFAQPKRGTRAAEGVGLTSMAVLAAGVAAVLLSSATALAPESEMKSEAQAARSEYD